MNLLGLIEEINIADPEFKDRISPRRDAIKNITSFGSKVTIAALPLVFSTLLKKAYGTVPTTQVNDVLNFALKLEYLESYFYSKGLATEPLNIPTADKYYFTYVAKDESDHVAFLQSVLGSAAVPSQKPYDITAGGAFPDVLYNYNTFTAVAETLEDTGVRAYKGQAPNLLMTDPYLTAALSIHAVEARHASTIRQLRMKNNFAPAIKPWITGANDSGIAAVAGNYAGEDNVIQLGIDVTTLPAVSGTTSFNTATEAFDEPLTMAQVLPLVAPFGVS